MQLLLLIRDYQVNGHLTAKLDPLGLDGGTATEGLDLGLYGFTEADLDRAFFLGDVWRMPGEERARAVLTLRDVLGKLQRAYCGSVGYEYMHIHDGGKRGWLRDRIEAAGEPGEA